MINSILDERNKLLSYPLRKFSPWFQEIIESDNPRVSLSGMALIAIAATPTFLGNIVLPGNMILMGLRPQPVVEGITYVKSAIGYPMPVWNVLHGASPASKVGQRLGKRIAGKAGVKIGARVAGRLIPGVGWALFAYDVYDIAYNRSLWGFDF